MRFYPQHMFYNLNTMYIRVYTLVILPILKFQYDKYNCCEYGTKTPDDGQ